MPREEHVETRRGMPLREESAAEAVTIVSGLPRSGTSMMMQLLAAGGIPALTDNVREADEDNPRGYYEFEAVKEVAHNRSWLDGAEGKVVKMVYRLLYDLPDDYRYRVVFMLRPLEEVIASQEEMLKRLGKPSGDISLEQMAAIYRRQLEDVRTWLARQPNFEVLYVRYHDVLNDTEHVVKQLNGFLGSKLDTAAMLRVPDRSLYRQKRA
jgi:hypothetical protein